MSDQKCNHWNVICECVECGMRIDIDSKISELQSTITKQAELIRRLVEVGDRLVKRWWEYHCDETITCKYCGLQQGKFENKHTDDCPITLHTALMNDIEKREG